MITFTETTRALTGQVDIHSPDTARFTTHAHEGIPPWVSITLDAPPLLDERRDRAVIYAHPEDLPFLRQLRDAAADAVRWAEGQMCATCCNAPPSGEGSQPALCAACALLPTCTVCDEPTGSTEADLCPACDAARDERMQAQRWPLQNALFGRVDGGSGGAP